MQQLDAKIEKRLAALEETKVFKSLGDSHQNFIKDKAQAYQLTHQDLQQLTEMTVDLAMWGEISPETAWQKEEGKPQPPNDQLRKKNLLQGMREQWSRLKERGPIYISEDSSRIKPPKRDLTVLESDHTVLGWCPVASPKTVCCNLRTLDAVQGCGMGCSYCSIQTFYDDRKVGVDSKLAEKLEALQLDSSHRYHIGSGQSSDSLLLGDRQGILSAQLEFARRNPNIVYEFKTKSKNISALLRADLPKNFFVSWSLNTLSVIEAEEHGTANLDSRLATARRLADHGVKVGFHFHPIVRYEGYLEDYPQLIARVMSEFRPEEIAFISMGTLTWIKPAIKSLRMRGIKSGLLQMEMDNAAGNMSYPMDIKKEMFGMAMEAFAPWRDKVFFYFCMEDRELWHSVMGKCYPDNEAFEQDMLDALFGKLGLDFRSEPAGPLSLIKEAQA